MRRQKAKKKKKKTTPTTMPPRQNNNTEPRFTASQPPQDSGILDVNHHSHHSLIHVSLKFHPSILQHQRCDDDDDDDEYLSSCSQTKTRSDCDCYCSRSSFEAEEKEEQEQEQEQATVLMQNKSNAGNQSDDTSAPIDDEIRTHEEWASSNSNSNDDDYAAEYTTGQAPVVGNDEPMQLPGQPVAFIAEGEDTDAARHQEGFILDPFVPTWLTDPMLDAILVVCVGIVIMLVRKVQELTSELHALSMEL
mmetsp:Transcript_2022/g.3220  ORF Transcript_2022/g.3220 Transcript_2022/m.3220 type:complete len:249 (+) Transcript_2022:313-1059(+)